jgi:drug/metabolite transporter (DMT)-like permease
MALPTSFWSAAALTFNAFVWGVSWWPFRRLDAHGLHPLWATVAIYALAVVVLVAARPGVWREVLRHRGLWVLVLASGTTNAAFNWAVTIGDVVRVVLLFYLMPLWAVLLARPLLGERLHRDAAARVGLSLVGAVVVLWPADGGWPLPRTLAEALGLLGGVTFALNNVMLRREARCSEAARAAAMFTGGALVAGLLALALTSAGRVGAPPPLAPGWALGVLAMGGAFLASNLALQYGAAQLPAHATAVIMLTEVVFASVSAVALGAGALTLHTLAGGALIVAAAAMAALARTPAH